MPPEILAAIDLRSLRVDSNTLVAPEGGEQRSDVLLHVTWRDAPALVYVLVEHKSRVDRWVFPQMLGYMLRIWHKTRTRDRLAPLRPIIPVVVSHADRGWRGPSSFADLFGPILDSRPELRAFVPDFDLVHEDLPFAYFIAVAPDLTALRFRDILSLAEIEGEDVVPTLAQTWMAEGCAEGLRRTLRRHSPRDSASSPLGTKSASPRPTLPSSSGSSTACWRRRPSTPCWRPRPELHAGRGDRDSRRVRARSGRGATRHPSWKPRRSRRS